MPYTIRKQKCKQSDGDSGNYVLKYTDKSGKKHSACHTSHEKAKGQIAAIEMRRESDVRDSQDLIESLVKALIIEDGLETSNIPVSLELKNRCDTVSWISNINAAETLVSALENFGAELQQQPSRPDNNKKHLIFRIRFLSDESQEASLSKIEKSIGEEIKRTTGCDTLKVGPLQKNYDASARYPSIKIDFPVPEGREKHPETLYVVLVTSQKDESDAGNSGPGENEFIDIVNKSGASESNPVILVIGNKKFENVTGAIKPKTVSGVGEPKIDILLLSKNGRAHPHGAFSFKLASSLGGAPTYGGWSTIKSHLPSAVPELEKFLSLYLTEKNPTKNPDGTYEFVGNFAMKTSDDVAEFSIYGSDSTSGGKDYGKSKVDYVVEVFDRPASSVNSNGEIVIKNLKLHDAHESAGEEMMKDSLLFRDTEWEPYWLIRGAKGRDSGTVGGIVIKNSRIAVAPAKRAASYVSPASSNRFDESRKDVGNIISEELTAADKREIERISRRQARIELDRAVGPDLGKAIREEVSKILGSRATRDEITDMIEAVLKRIHVEIGH